MDFLSQPLDLYQKITKGMESVWLVVKPDPGGKNNYLFAQDIEPNEGWHIAEQIIRNAANRFNKFNICVAPNKNAMQTVIPVSVVPSFGTPGQVAGIGSLPGQAGVYGYPGADIGRIIEEKVAAVQKEWEHKDELRRRDEELAALRYEIKERKKSKGDFFDKLGAFCIEQEIDLNPVVEKLPGMIAGLFSPRRQHMPALAGFPNRSKTAIHRKDTNEPVPHGEDGESVTEEQIQTEEEMDANEIALNEAVQKELLFNGERDERILALEYAKVINATIRLHQFIGGLQASGLAGDDLDAINILTETAEFIIKNPIKAQELVKQMKG
jgi:hypothetical protein